MWKPDEFLSASASMAVPRAGYTYRGMGLYILHKASPKGRRPPTWCLLHLGSGHAIVNIVGKVADVFPIASRIAECSDWDFDGLDGWRNRDPELPRKIKEILSTVEPKRLRFGGGFHSEKVASEIAIARA